jgi:hypothetical protein
MSRKQIKIGYRDTDDIYVVISVKNATDYLPGTKIARAEVQRLCDGRQWEVTLVPLNVEAK